MPRFYFDLSDGTHIGDEDGTELEGVVEARVEGIKLAGACLRDSPSLLWSKDGFPVMILDDNRTLLTTVTISATDSQVMQDRLRVEAVPVHEVGAHPGLLLLSRRPLAQAGQQPAI